MLTWILLAVFVVLALATFFYFVSPKRNAPERTPDRPRMLYSHHWFAVHCSDTAAVLDTLHVVDPQPCNWESADDLMRKGASEYVFIAPPIDGWILLFGGLPELRESEPYGPTWKLLLTLSQSFGEAQYFQHVDAVNANAWAKACDGEIVRAYSCADAFIAWNEGTITPEERAAEMVYGESGFKGQIELEDDDGDYLPEHPDLCAGGTAFDIADRWSINPASLIHRNDLTPSAGTWARLNSSTLSQ